MKTILALTVVCSAGLAPLAADDAKALLQEGLFAEEAEQKLDKAADRYQEVLVFGAIAQVRGCWGACFLAITGSLLAFERETKTGKVSIVKDDKVRLLVGKKDFTIPLTRLSPDDQIYIQNLEDSARIAGKLIEPPKAAKKEPTDKKSGAEEKKAQPSSAGDK